MKTYFTYLHIMWDFLNNDEYFASLCFPLGCELAEKATFSFSRSSIKYWTWTKSIYLTTVWNITWELIVGDKICSRETLQITKMKQMETFPTINANFLCFQEFFFNKKKQMKQKQKQTINKKANAMISGKSPPSEHVLEKIKSNNSWGLKEILINFLK